MQVALLSFVASAEISPLSRLGGMPEALSPHTREKECGPLPDGGACHPFAQKGNLTPPWSRELTIRLVLRLCPPPLSLPHLGALVSWGAGRRGQRQRRVLGCHRSHNAPAQLDALFWTKPSHTWPSSLTWAQARGLGFDTSWGRPWILFNALLGSDSSWPHSASCLENKKVFYHLICHHLMPRGVPAPKPAGYTETGHLPGCGRAERAHLSGLPDEVLPSLGTRWGPIYLSCT